MPRGTASGRATAPVTLIKGSEPALVNRAVQQITKSVRSAAPNVEVTEFSASTYEEGELVAHASASLFAEDKLLIITELEQMSDAFVTDFESYLKAPSSQVWVVAHHAGGNRGARVLTALKSAGYPQIDAAPIKRDDDKVDLVLREIDGLGGSITNEAAQNLVSALGANLEEMLSSARQLAFDTAGTITAETVHTFHRGRVETRPHEVANALARHDATNALLLARQAFATKVPPVVIVAALASKFRLLAKAKIPGVTAAELKVPAWQLNQARRDAGRWTEEGLGVAIKAIANADAAVKGESRTPEGAIELCIFEMSRVR